ncbi:MAG: hypothetical protein GY929_01395 [Actinomycetia bacterium]|nr:hypothetical protein [Actinomycetes bacterium]
MTVQAVPTAKYAPCLNELRLGWDSVEWFAESGRAGIRIARDFDTFLTATVTETCDTSEAVAVDSGHPDMQRFEDIESQQAEIEIVIVPSGEQPLGTARQLAEQLNGVQIGNRPVAYTIDTAIDDPVGSRSELALSRGVFVWIIDELDVEEGTVQLRSNKAAATGRGLVPGDALDLIEGASPGVFYRGSWFFTFEGGCITYEFDATGILAETIAADAENALGFYPALELRQGSRDAGFEIG